MLEKLGVQDTAAYRIIRQVTDHTWGPDVDLSDADVRDICVSFYARGGSWESLMAGDMGCVAHLERSIDELVGPKRLAAMASSAGK